MTDDLIKRLRVKIDPNRTYYEGHEDLLRNEAANAIEAQQNRIRELRKMDFEAAKYVETVICARTGFSGEDPYTGWKGLGLALTEALDERDLYKNQINSHLDKITYLLNTISVLEKKIQDEREACAETAISETIDNPVDESDEAYNRAINHIVSAIRARRENDNS